MRIAVDVDEVLGNFTDPMVDFLNTKLENQISKQSIRRYRFWKDLGLTMDDGIKLINEFYFTDLFRNMKPVSGSIRGIRELKKKHELYVITSRESRIIGKETKDWLERHFKDSFHGVYFASNPSFGRTERPKHELCKKIGADVIIEDSLYTARECANAGIMVFLIDYPWNHGELPSNIIRVKSWSEIVARMS